MENSAAVSIESEEVDIDRRRFLTVATIGTGAAGLALATAPFIASWRPSERARALGGPTSVDLAPIEPGQMIIVNWRRQPIYIVRRTEEFIEAVAQAAGRLKDADSSESQQPPYAHNRLRSRVPEFLVLVGICTHLGCLPKARFDAGLPELGADWPGGFFCPCHGSRFDLAGRVFEGSPASVNLVVPPHTFASERTLIVGLDEPPAASIEAHGARNGAVALT